jgi:peptidoglycan/xylan/chitin deacetylase (PgdA/CDA1 family)
MGSPAHSLLKSVAAGVDLLRRPAPGLVVLIYHRVGGRTPVEVDLPLALFDEQIGYLAQCARCVSLDEGVRSLREPDNSDDWQVVVTFDDGTADFAELAVPVLERHEVPATLFLATRFVEEGVPFPNDGRPISWSALADALSTGVVQIGSHTHSHALLDRIPVEHVRDELDRSKGLIEDRLGVSADHFAYPKAVRGSRAAEQVVRDRFRSAALAGTHPNQRGATDLYRLARSPIQRADGMRWFTRKVRGGMELEDRLRSMLDRRRYGDATT